MSDLATVFDNMLTIISLMRSKPTCAKAVAFDLGISVRTAQRYVRQLSEQGYIERVKGGFVATKKAERMVIWSAA